MFGKKKKAVEDKESTKKKVELLIKSKRNHQPGRKHQLPDGTTYQVSKTGAWVRTSLRLVESKSSVRVRAREAVITRLLGAN
jgi:hypothetical protein